MSRYISNKPCEMCKKIELGLVEMKVGDTHHYLCYNCMNKFAWDVIEYAAHNLREEFKLSGWDIDTKNDGGYVISRRK